MKGRRAVRRCCGTVVWCAPVHAGVWRRPQTWVGDGGGGLQTPSVGIIPPSQRVPSVHGSSPSPPQWRSGGTNCKGQARWCQNPHAVQSPTARTQARHDVRKRCSTSLGRVEEVLELCWRHHCKRRQPVGNTTQHNNTNCAVHSRPSRLRRSRALQSAATATG